MARHMADAMSLENYERWQKGLPPIKEEKPVIPEPKKPKVKNLILLDKLKMGDVIAVPEGRRKNIKNDEGTIFTGFEVTILMKEGKDGKGEKTISGWMPSSDFHKFRRELLHKHNMNLKNIEF